jgi:hypothetical protein
MDKQEQRIGELEDALKDRERRIADLKEERDEQAETIKELREQLEEWGALNDRWIEAFDMVLDDDGTWHWKEGLIQDRDKWFNKFQELRALWNKNVAAFNAKVAPRNMGRPLQASEAQSLRVSTKRAAGQSLRSIAEDMELSLQTVRTILDKEGRRGSRHHLQAAAHCTRQNRRGESAALQQRDRRPAQAHQR